MFVPFSSSLRVLLLGCLAATLTSALPSLRGAEAAEPPKKTKAAKGDKSAADPADDQVRHKVPRDMHVQDHIVYNHSLNAAGQPVTLLFIPPQKKLSTKAPLVIFVHGGGWSQGDNLNLFKPDAIAAVRQLSEAGCAVASVEYRLAFDGGTTMVECAADCWDAMRFFVKEAAQFKIDPKSVGLWGESAGGQLVLAMALGQNADFPGDPALKAYVPQVKCVVGFYAPSSFVNPVLSARWDTSRTRLFGPGTEEQQREVARRMSPAEWVRPGAPPIFLVQGADDTLVLPEHAHYMQKKAAEQGVSCEVLEVKGARHGFKGNAIDPSMEVIHQRTAEFLIKHLLPQAKP